MLMTRPAGAGEVVGEHLHVAREHHEVDVVLLHDLAQHLLGLRLGLGGHRDVVEGDAVRRHQRLEVTVVRDDGGDVHVEGPDRQRNSRSLRQ